ncbi:MAG: 30S ribosomal protein S7 [Candidatus Paceibacterota bacterium]
MRRKIKRKNILEPDFKYSSLLVSSFINKIMKNGKRSVAEKIVYGALESVEKEIKKPALEALDAALDNAGPQLELKSRRIGGANYQVPHEVRGERKVALATKWIIEAARGQKGKPMKERLAQEIISAYNNTGAAIKKKQDTHRMAEANKAFAHFAW